MKTIFETEDHDNIFKIYEQPPQTRTINIYQQYNSYNFAKNETKYFKINKPILVNLPYLYFFLNIAKVYDDDSEYYIHRGQTHANFQVFASKSPINSINDSIDFLAFETKILGVICIDHAHDNKMFLTVDKLENFVFSEFYALRQSLEIIRNSYKFSICNITMNEFEIEGFLLDFWSNPNNHPMTLNIETYEKLLYGIRLSSTTLKEKINSNLKRSLSSNRLN